MGGSVCGIAGGIAGFSMAGMCPGPVFGSFTISLFPFFGTVTPGGGSSNNGGVRRDAASLGSGGSWGGTPLYVGPSGPSMISLAYSIKG